MLRLAVTVAAAALVTGLASAATVTGTSAGDVLTGTPRADVLDGRAGKDTIAGLGGADFILGGPGRDIVDAGAGDDRIPAHGDGLRDATRCGAGIDIVTADAVDVVSRDCEVVSRQISSDRTSDPTGQHATQVEPDTFAFGSTVVSVFQTGRVVEGGAVGIGFSTSRDAGATWKSGLAPGCYRLLSTARLGRTGRATPSSRTTQSTAPGWPPRSASRTSSYFFYVNRSSNGLAWSAPVAAVTGPVGDLDKEWITCDNEAASPFRGHCYLSYFHVRSGEIRTTTTTDGGLTWSQPVASSPVPPQGLDFNGAQPLVLPNGTLIVVYTAFADPRSGARSEIQATRSTDGGASFSAPVRAALFSTAAIPAMRTFALASAEVDAAGRMYVAWEGCPGDSCSASRIVMTTSVDGVTWTPAQSVTAGGSGVDHFLPGIAANPAAAGRLALVFHSIPDDCANLPPCPGIDVFHTTSKDGGRTWSKQQRLTAEPIALDSIAHTRIGLMLADYVSTSYVRGRPVSVFVLASPRVNGRYRQAAFAYR